MVVDSRERRREMTKEKSKGKKVHRLDFTIITWLAVKLVIDTAAFIYIVWRLLELKK